ncbi:dual specificity protein phosphatase 19-like [Oscarella lobularis]|uniref:dual specificity protein phosphatase 19-like n=1 Tax=Oscarella lobularis TaxID=121494 RepID=UPI003314385D
MQQTRLSDAITGFNAKSLRRVDIHVTTPGGRHIVEMKDSRLIEDRGRAAYGGFCPDLSPDLQLGQPLPRLFIGSQDVAHDLKLMKANGITRVLNVASGVENKFPEDLVYFSVEILDVPETNLWPYLIQCLDFIDSARTNGFSVLVHCNAGISRSAAVVCAYIMKTEGKGFNEALDLVKAHRPNAKPNDGFVKQLKENEEKLIARK